MHLVVSSNELGKLFGQNSNMWIQDKIHNCYAE